MVDQVILNSGIHRSKLLMLWFLQFLTDIAALTCCALHFRADMSTAC